MRKLKWLYTGLILILAVLAVTWAVGFDRLRYIDFSMAAIMGVLAPLLVVATFLERAQEVFIKTWRKAGREKLEHDVKVAETNLENANQSGDQAKIHSATQALHADNGKLIEYKAGTRARAFLVGVTGGIVISLAGVRLRSQTQTE